jgi:hypothetical protein
MPGNTSTSSTTSNDSEKKKNETEKLEGFLSWPKFGKHLSFDGRYLHAAPADIMEKGAFQKQIQIQGEESLSKEERVKLQRRHRRVTFLVNVWLNYKPFGVKTFPETMVDKLSGYREGQAKVNLKLQQQKEQNHASGSNSSAASTLPSTLDQVEICGGKAISKGSLTESKAERFEWPLGDCNSEESIQVDVPLGRIREEATKGGSLKLAWKSTKGDSDGEPSGLRLCLGSGNDRTISSVQRPAESDTGDAENLQGAPKRPRLE